VGKTTKSQSTLDLSPKHQTSEISLKTSEVVKHCSQIGGGRSHFFRLRTCFKILESGSGSGNFSNLRIRLLFRLWLQSSIQP